MNKPVKKFKDENEAKKYLKEWQHRLFLDNWIIHVYLVKKEEFVSEDKEISGENEFNRVNHCAIIRMLDIDDCSEQRMLKTCHEKTLVHELLHCKYSWMNYKDTIEGNYFDCNEHELLEEMAKSLIMAKYNIGLDWFNNE